MRLADRDKELALRQRRLVIRRCAKVISMGALTAWMVETEEAIKQIRGDRDQTVELYILTAELESITKVLEERRREERGEYYE